jgi:hypothetical protein
VSTQAVLEKPKKATLTTVWAGSFMPQRRLAWPGQARAAPGQEPSSPMPELGHDFGKMPVQPAIQTCPRGASPRACPSGGACHTCPVGLQAKLATSEPGDEYEREADRVAAAVVKMADPGPWLVRAPAMQIVVHGASPLLARQQPAATWSDEEYAKKLRHAVDRLRAVGFGRAEVTATAPGGFSQERYDLNFWEVKPWTLPGGQMDRKLVLRQGKSAHDAMMQLIADPGSWSLDCAQFEQVAQLYAFASVLGKDAFDSRQRSLGGAEIALKPYGSTGVVTEVYYYRYSPTQNFTRSTDLQGEPRNGEQLLADAPIGSRITWTNSKAAPSSDWQHENALKMGNGLYAAHGFTRGNNTFTRDEIERKLANCTNPTADDAYIRQAIFVSRIEVYKKPESKATPAWTPKPAPPVEPPPPPPPRL